MIEILIEKLLNSFYKNETCKFKDDEIEYIMNQKINFLINDQDKNIVKLYYLLANVVNNLDSKFLDYVKNILSMINMYFIDENIQNFTLFGIEIKYLIENFKDINGIKLSIEQNKIYDLFNEKSIHYFYLKSKTGSGKTFLTSSFLVERYNNSSNKKNKFIMLVPTELLEEQIIFNLQKTYKNLKNIIGNNVDNNYILIVTPEKLISYINSKYIDIFIDTLIIDEAHIIFDVENERGEFLKYIIKEYLNKFEIDKIILLSPFDFDEKQKEILIDFLKTENLLKIDYNKNNICNKFNINSLEKNKNNEKKYNECILKNTNSVSCIYTNSKNNVKKIIKKYINDKEYLNNIYMSWINEFSKEELKEINNIFNSKEYDFFHKYLNFNYIKKGICYLTADVPNQIKLLIIDLVKKRYIRLVVASSLIIAGIDLPFDITFLNSHKVNDKQLSNNEIVNFFGRAGRINEYKRAFGAGFSYIKVNKNNYKWWQSNKNEIIAKMENNDLCNSFIVDEKECNKNYIKKSFDFYKNTGDKRYVYDPRINPEITKKIIDFATNENYKYILQKLFKNNPLFQKNWLDNYKIKNDNDSAFYALAILFIYKIHDYKNNINFQIKNFEYSNDFLIDLENLKKYFINNPPFLEKRKNNIYLSKKINFYLNFYISESFDLDKSLIRFLSWLSPCEKDENRTSATIELFVEINKEYGKFYLLTFLNHFWMLIDKPKFTNFHTILFIYVFNFDFYIFLKNNDFLEIISKIILENEEIKNEWIKLNNIDNDINDIFLKIKNMSNDNVLFQKLENNGIAEKLNIFLKDKDKI